MIFTKYRKEKKGMSVFCSFRRFFRWVICAPLVTVGAEQYANANSGCEIDLYRAYDNTDSSYLYYTDLADTVSLGDVSYVGGYAWPTTGLVAPTRNGYSFDGYYMGNTQYYSSSMTSVTNAPQACMDGGLLAYWTLEGCPAGVDNIDYSPPTRVTTAETIPVSSSGWTVVLNTDRQLSGYWACSNIPGGYDVTYGYSTAAYNAMSANAATGDYCWCRLDRVDSFNGTAWVGPRFGYGSTQWVYSGMSNPSCSGSTRNGCATYCATMAAGTADANTSFRKTLYGQNCPFTIQYHNTSGHTNTTLMPTSYTYEDTPVDLLRPVPSNNSEEFAGWYTSPDLSGSPVERISQTTSDTENKHYYAKWRCVTGYTEQPCPLNGVNPQKDGERYEYVEISASSYEINDTELFPGEWSIEFLYGTVRGSAQCVNSGNTWDCQCKPTMFSNDHSFASGHAQGIGTILWVTVGQHPSQSLCEASCAGKCAVNISGDPSFRERWGNCKKGCQPNVCFVNYRNLNNEETWPTPRMTPTLFSTETPVASFAVSNPSRLTHTFVSWCKNANLTNCSDSMTIATNSCTTDQSEIDLYANWGCATGYTQGACPLNGKYGSKITGNYDYISQDGTQFSANAVNLTLFNSEWQQKFADSNNGTFIVRGKSVCSESSNVPAGTAPSSTGGKYCWCKPTLYIDENNNYYGVGTVPWWSGTGSFSDESSCISGCAARCESGTVNFKCESGCQPNVCFVDYHNLNDEETWPTPRITPTLFSAETPVDFFEVSTPSRLTHTFVSWCEDSGLTNCSNSMTIATNSCTIDQSTIDLYANWNQLYTLSYLCDNDATPPSSTNVASGNVVWLADEDSACNGHTLCETVRWNCVDTNNNNVNVVNNGITMPAANVICTLDRNTISYVISVDGNGGSGELTVNENDLLIPQGEGDSFQCQCGTTVTLPEWGAPYNTLTQNGKVFTGWVDSNTGNPITESFDCANGKVVATWCDCVQNCRPGSNSASCSYTGVVNNSCSYDYSCSTGYNNNDVLSGNYYAAAGTCPSPVTGPSCNGNEIVLQWYNQNTQLNNEPQSCIYGTPYSAATGAISTIVPPTRPGYDFAGWTVTGHQQ